MKTGNQTPNWSMAFNNAAFNGAMAITSATTALVAAPQAISIAPYITAMVAGLFAYKGFKDFAHGLNAPQDGSKIRAPKKVAGTPDPGP